MVLPGLIRSAPCWLLSLPGMGLVMLMLVVLFSMLFSLGPQVVWFWINEVEFLRHWDWYGVQVDAITAESRSTWCFHHLASGILILLVPCVVGSIGKGIVMVVPCFGCWGNNLFSYLLTSPQVNHDIPPFLVPPGWIGWILRVVQIVGLQVMVVCCLLVSLWSVAEQAGRYFFPLSYIFIIDLKCHIYLSIKLLLLT